MLSRPYHQPSKTLSFAPFAKLPPELQCLIWNHALPGPQIITITSKWRGPRQSRSRYKYSAEKPRALYKVPSIFHACSDSRQIALATYQPSFRHRLEHPIFFDIEQDTLFMLDGPTVAKFYQSTSRLLDESEDIEDSVRHMIIALGNKVTLRTINRLYQFNFVTLGLETCRKEDFTILMPDGREICPVHSLSGTLLRNLSKHMNQHSLPTIEYLTRQQMFDISDIGQHHKPYQNRYNVEFEDFVHTLLPHLDANMLYILKTKIYPPIFNGMRLMEKAGYYTQEERYSRFLDDLHDEDFWGLLED